MSEYRQRHGLLNEPFSAWLARELAGRQLSQRALAKRAGIDHSAISRLLRSKREPQLATVKAILRGLHAGDPARPLPVRLLDEHTARTTCARVEYALRADPQLTPAGVRAVMIAYQHARRLP